MAIAVTLDRKALWLILEAMNERIASEDARYRTVDPAEDDAGDFGNDLYYLKTLRDEFAMRHQDDGFTARIYQCWSDPADSSLSLLQLQKVAEHRNQGMLSDQAVMLYEFAAATGEEAMAIHCLRQGWAPYMPMGKSAPCPQCGATYYPECYGDCWRCGHIG
jgi:hypothetical protein